jgi:hypothetical protein
MVAKLKAIKAELQRRKHHRTTEVGAWLRKVVLGYYQYHAVPGNSTQLRIFQRRVCWLWRSVLVRRSQRAQVRWDRLSPVFNRWIPQPAFCMRSPDEPLYRLLSCYHGVVGSVMCEPLVTLDARVPQRGILVAAEREHRLIHLLGIEYLEAAHEQVEVLHRQAGDD